MRLGWPMVGRTEEIDVITAAVLDPQTAGIVIYGGMGVGKSRVAKEALNALAESGCTVHWTVGSSSAKNLPLGAFAAWADPEFGDPLKLVSGVITSLASTESETVVAVGVDDGQLLDHLSTFVLQQLVHRSLAKVVLTIRDDEPVPDELQEILRLAQFERLDLQPLSLSETTELINANLDGQIDAESARRFWRLSGGNALYLRNLVECELADCRLERDGDCWTWTRISTLPRGLTALVESRIGELSESVCDVIDILAIGEPLDLATVIAMTDPAAVEEADTRGLISLEYAGTRVEVRIAHPLYGEVRRDRAAPTRLRRLRGRVACALALADNRDDLHIVVRRAVLTLESNLNPDGDLFAQAAKGAIWQWDLPLADRLADAAISAGSDPEASLVRGYALSCLSRGSEAEEVLAAVSTIAISERDRSRLAFLRAINRLFTLADPRAAKDFIDDARESVEPHERACIDAFLTVYWAAAGKPHTALEAARRYDWHLLPDVVAARVSAWGIALAAAESGKVGTAITAAQSGYDVPIRSFVIIADAHISAFLLAGMLAEARAPAEMIRERSRNMPALQFRLLANALAGRVDLAVGHLAEACATLGSLVPQLLRLGDHNGWVYRCQIPYTTALAMRGLTDEAATALSSLAAQRHPSWRYLDHEYAIAQAWTAAAQGAVSEAITTVLRAAEIARSNEQYAPEVMCLQTATQFGDHTAGGRLAELGSLVEGPRVGLATRFATALKRDDATELRSVSEGFEQMGDLVAAVDAAAHASTMFRRQDLRGSALGCEAVATELAAQCGGALTPALRQATEKVDLTPREREIVMMVGAGLSTREIAERLFLSVRTVEGHIYRAMGKSGADNREDVAALLRARKSIGS